MATENFSDEGLDRILSWVPRNASAGSLDTNLWAAAITAAGTSDGTTTLTGSIVPSRTTIWASDYQTSGGAGRGGGGEPAIGTGAYARCIIANGNWQAQQTSGTGRRTTSNQVSFTPSTAAWGPAAGNQNVIGNAIVTASAAGSGVAYYYSNFSDSSTVPVNASGIVLQVTPFWHYDI